MSAITRMQYEECGYIFGIHYFHRETEKGVVQQLLGSRFPKILSITVKSKLRDYRYTKCALLLFPFIVLRIRWKQCNV